MHEEAPFSDDENEEDGGRNGHSFNPIRHAPVGEIFSVKKPPGKQPILKGAGAEGKQKMPPGRSGGANQKGQDVAPPRTARTAGEAKKAAKIRNMDMETKHSDPAHIPFAPPKRTRSGSESLPSPIVTDTTCVDPDEEYGCHEKALDEFSRLHPMLSLGLFVPSPTSFITVAPIVTDRCLCVTDAASARTLQLVASLVPDMSIPVKEVPIVPKSHDDIFLRPPNTSVGERPCSCGDRCITRWLAIWRHGQDSKYAFVCREFLLPDQNASFCATGSLPERVGKCLLCSRYYTTYVYRMARLDPSFKPSASIQIQAYGNVVCEGLGSDAVTSSSPVGTTDGYSPSAMLFVDEKWADTHAARGEMSALLWRPCVKYSSSHYNFEEAGVFSALERLDASLREELSGVASIWIGDETPAWVTEPDIAIAASMIEGKPKYEYDAMDACRAFRRMGCAIEISRLYGSEAVDSLAEPPQPVCPPELECIEIVALVRIAYGEMLEKYTAWHAEQICSPKEVPVAQEERRTISRLFNDSYLVALWTSAHAEYVANVSHSLSFFMADSDVGRSLPIDVPVPFPDVHSTISLSSAVDMSIVFERRNSTDRSCVSKHSVGIQSILSRCTNAGSRGWETTLSSALSQSDGCCRFVSHILTSCLSGMNPMIHPATRPGWRQRSDTRRACSSLSTPAELRSLSEACSLQVKEACRAYLAMLLGMEPATREAFSASSNAAGQLTCPPLNMPHHSLQSALQSFSLVSYNVVASPARISGILSREAFTETRVRKKAFPKTQKTANGNMYAVNYASTWLGGRFQYSTAASVPFPKFALTIITNSFKADFVPFWAHANAFGKRVSRLDACQFSAMHNSNAAFKLCSLLSTRDSLRIQRLAMQNGASSLLSVDGIVSMTGVELSNEWKSEKRTEASVNGSRIQPWIEERYFSLGSYSAAIVLHFAKCALLRDAMLSFDLGEKTRGMQKAALRKRLLLKDEDDVEESAPQHAVCLMCCSECKRVANACQDNTGKDVPFNEIGISACMLHTAPNLKESHLRCAKRSSAAVRTSLVLEEQSKKQMPEMDDLRDKGMPQLSSSSQEWSTVIGKLRRDCKNCIDQGEFALSCGDQPLVSINIVGRAVRVFGSFYALCAFCGVVVKMEPDLFYAGQPCCGKCDSEMLMGKDVEEGEANRITSASTPTCRYCGRREVSNSSSKWKCIPAPADDGGKNADIPPPLRTVHYCPTHFRPWLIAAHRTLSTAVVFAHIGAKAKPMFGAETGKRSLDDAEKSQRLAEIPLPPKKKTRKIPRPKQKKT